MKPKKNRHRFLKTSVVAVCCVAGITAGAAGLSSLQNHRSFPETITHFLHILLDAEGEEEKTVSADLSDLPAWDGQIAVTVNHDSPSFYEEDMDIPEGMVIYSSPDALGRCGPVTASVCSRIMPEEDRDDAQERIQITPTGYAQTTYPEELVEHGFLYNRCHLLGWQLGGDASAVNLFAGTRALNVEGMLPYENRVARYARSHPSNHVLYRVTPVFAGNDLNCTGVLMEAYSLEDNGALQFCVFVYNEQPGIVIDHSTGSSRVAQTEQGTDSNERDEQE